MSYDYSENILVLESTGNLLHYKLVTKHQFIGGALNGKGPNNFAHR